MLSQGQRVGVYEVMGPLGAGGMGEVYRARDTRLHREVALKVLPAAFAADPERMARFEREAQALASLNHPHIATVYGFEEAPAQGSPVRALAMELVPGETLADRLSRGALTIPEAVALAAQIAAALEAAHEQGIIHFRTGQTGCPCRMGEATRRAGRPTAASSSFISANSCGPSPLVRGRR